MTTVTIEEIDRRETAAGAEVWYEQKIYVTHADLTADATTQTISGTAVARCWPTGHVARYCPTLFGDGGTVTAVGVEFGDSGDPDGLAASANLWDGTGDGDGDGDADTDFATVDPGADASGETYHASYTPAIKFTSATSNLSALTAGQVAFTVRYKTTE